MKLSVLLSVLACGLAMVNAAAISSTTTKKTTTTKKVTTTTAKTTTTKKVTPTPTPVKLPKLGDSCKTKGQFSCTSSNKQIIMICGYPTSTSGLKWIKQSDCGSKAVCHVYGQGTLKSNAVCTEKASSTKTTTTKSASATSSPTKLPKLGDSCKTNGGFSCSSNDANIILVCSHATSTSGLQWIKSNVCGSGTKCQVVDGNTAVCATEDPFKPNKPLPKLYDYCASEGAFSCSSSSKNTVLTCGFATGSSTKTQWILNSECQSLTVCEMNGVNAVCASPNPADINSPALGKLGQACFVNGDYTCSTDKKTSLVCSYNHQLKLAWQLAEDCGKKKQVCLLASNNLPFCFNK